ncbi:TIGR02449 family protein [Pleionea mediterranea]|jgi:cell division protein ZapB|uniref:Cell division protein ZapB n=1 Tax=Pleionea mediterranea TaxID=523701 RepID=A0A316FZ88_9GAMM|nr:TIGR02449 family protein [Pleionea mediterranea]PWK53733.1 cell division protein ZapB [Pleionea mediterranea]
MENSEISQLEGRVDQLLERFHQIQQENRSLKVKQDELIADRARLLEKNKLATEKIESIVTRLKTME